MTRALRAAALLLACALAATAFARPKVCLVLSGGGARGAAHVGVIKVLQEMRIPIDCITGTSMGSIVGAAYASGTSTEEMEKIISEMSIADIVREKGPRQDLAYRIKEDDRSILLGPELGLTDKLEVVPPKGIVSGVALETVLQAPVEGAGLPQVRRARDPVPRRGDRPRHRQGGGLRRRRPRQRDARLDVGPGRDRARARSRGGCSSTAASPTTCRWTWRGRWARTS